MFFYTCADIEIENAKSAVALHAKNLEAVLDYMSKSIYARIDDIRTKIIRSVNQAKTLAKFNSENSDIILYWLDQIHTTHDVSR